MRFYFDAPAELLEHRKVKSDIAMEAVNSYFRQRYEHQCIYDEQLLFRVLRNSGFHPVLRARYGEGIISSGVILDDEKYAWESLYMEGIKPSAAAASE
jgi:hypothetical protein